MVEEFGGVGVAESDLPLCYQIVEFSVTEIYDPAKNAQPAISRLN